MSTAATFHGFVKDGQVVYTEAGRRAIWLQKNEGKRISEHLERETNPRSLRQNAYYWRVIVKEYVCNILESLLGEPVPDEDAHAWLKLRFLNRRSVDGVPLPVSSKSLSTDEFLDYCERIREHFLHTYQIAIPEPQKGPQQQEASA